MLQPMRTKFRKAHKGRIHGLATSGIDLAFGQYGLKALEPERITARQIEGARPPRPPAHEPRRPGMDPDLSGCAGVEEAARGAHGLRQGRPGILGGARETR